MPKRPNIINILGANYSDQQKFWQTPHNIELLSKSGLTCDLKHVKKSWRTAWTFRAQKILVSELNLGTICRAKIVKPGKKIWSGVSSAFWHSRYWDHRVSLAQELATIWCSSQKHWNRPPIGRYCVCVENLETRSTHLAGECVWFGLTWNDLGKKGWSIKWQICQIWVAYETRLTTSI